jgi:thioredoxin 1
MLEIEDLEEFNMILKDNKYVLVDFSAKWCNPCKVLQPQLEHLAKQYPNVKFIKVDVDRHPELVDFHNISAMPTIRFYIDNILIDDIVEGADITLINIYCKKFFI